MQSQPNREWTQLFVRTRTAINPAVDSVPSDESSSDEEMTEHNDTDQSTREIRTHSTSSSRVHIFNPRIAANTKRLKLGDRVFVSGFLSYYNHPLGNGDADGNVSFKSTFDGVEKHFHPRICAVIAQRLIFMGSTGEVSDSPTAQDDPDKPTVF